MSPLTSLLSLLLLSTVLADKPAVAPQYEPASSQPSQPQTDNYGSPQAPVTGDSYGSPAAPASQQASPVSNQGYYYYYYPVRQGNQAAEQSDDGLLGGLLGGGLLSAILGKKVIVIAISIAAILVAVAFGLNLTFGKRSFPDYSVLSEDNIVFAADILRRAIENYGY